MSRAPSLSTRSRPLLSCHDGNARHIVDDKSGERSLDFLPSLPATPASSSSAMKPSSLPSSLLFVAVVVGPVIFRTTKLKKEERSISTQLPSSHSRSDRAAIPLFVAVARFCRSWRRSPAILACAAILFVVALKIIRSIIALLVLLGESVRPATICYAHPFGTSSIPNIASGGWVYILT
eukprot:CAMPEP_0113572884 /NCGR_PEP_ID=MMETSP0015_2-20120614/26326_1 /TAXON_ID=2838 /ORGANISM="Odontella" /LENGTH=178 /DNA_ID=CAMNT_0000475933 /DNA_START=31 /DNA_END=567 /DNA_ORIENTATION=+ /assembly_acc=CAM_ASM_000160